MGNQPPSGQAPTGDGSDPRNLQQAAAAQRGMPPGYGGAGGYGMPQGAYGMPPGAGGVSHSYHGATASVPPNQLLHPQQTLSKSASDASMTLLDAENNPNAAATLAAAAAGGGGDNTMADATNLEAFLNDDTVPTVFRWEHGGRQVYITGTFNGWSRQIPMHRSGNDFTYIHNLKRGKHAFKFIVDDEWRFAPDQPTVADIEGRINNFIDVTEFKAYTGDREFEKEKAAAEYGVSSIDAEALPDGGAGEGEAAKAVEEPEGSGTVGSSAKPDRDGEVFSNTMPDLDDYTKEPPPLPPHLRHIILNKPPQLQDTAALPVPQHVALNHLYCTAIKDNMMVLGITQRYKTKFVTTVYYSPCASK